MQLAPLQKDLALISSDQETKLVSVSQKLETVFFSRRSIQRQTAAITDKLTECINKNQKLFFIAPLTDAWLPWLTNLEADKKKKLVWLTVNQIDSDLLTRAASQLDQLIASDSDIFFFINNIETSDRFEIYPHPVINSFHITEKFLELSQFVIKQAAQRLKTIANFQFIWQYNFRRNLKLIRKGIFLNERQQFRRPSAFVLGGKSVDQNLHELKKHKIIWCADTALPCLEAQNIIPDLVFSIDAGKGSMEHFIGLSRQFIGKLNIVTDCLSFPGVLRLIFQKIFFYKSSHPLIQHERLNQEPIFNNERGDVYGLMQSVLSFYFQGTEPPKLFGFDNNRHQNYITHMRGSAYYRYRYMRDNRLETVENYFLRLSLRLFK